MLLLIEIIGILMNVFVTIIIVNFVLSLLVMFNVISPTNEAVRTIQSSLNQVLEPILAPVRRIMPDTGAIDFSPIVVIIGARILQEVLLSIAGNFA
jgi:YggT family protein